MANRISVESAIRKAVKIFNGEPASRFPANVPSTANNESLKSINAAKTGFVDLIGASQDDTVQIAGGHVKPPTRIPCIFKAVLNAHVTTTRFHIFNYAGRITKITEIHNTAGDHASAVTLHVTKEVSGEAPGAGVSVMDGTFNLKGTANTLQTATLSSAVDAAGESVLEFAAGEMLSVKLTGNAQTAAGVLIVVWVQPYVRAMDFSWYSAAGTAVDQVFAIANRNYPIRAIRYAHATAETTDTTANMQVTVDDGTEAPGAGTNLLTNDSNAGFDMNATANVPQLGVLAAATTLIAGERLAVDFSDASVTESAGICVTVTVYPEADRLEITDWLHDTDVTDHWFFIADRDYQLWDGRQIHKTAAGGVSTANVEKASGTTNASGGTAVLNTAWNLQSAGSTIQVADYVTVKATTLLAENDRLAIDFAHTEQSTDGFCQTLSLLAR